LADVLSERSNLNKDLMTAHNPKEAKDRDWVGDYSFRSAFLFFVDSFVHSERSREGENQKMK